MCIYSLTKTQQICLCESVPIQQNSTRCEKYVLNHNMFTIVVRVNNLETNDCCDNVYPVHGLLVNAIMK